ncbi:MAG: HlyD family efflux transporter periplasmic adaptor subunit [Anaerolineae bacterium]|nr:HlyD family efflux transporter periplasmic adaptor subunit [Anaerolineae bacterium]
MRRLSRVLVTAGVVTALAASVFLFIQGQNAGAQETASDVIDETVVRTDTLRVTIGATGSIAPQREVTLSFELPNVLNAIFVSEGQAVAAGDVLAQQDADSLAAALGDARIGRDLAQISYDALLAPPRDVDVAAAQAAINVAEAQLAASYSTASPEQADIAQLQAELARNQLWQAQLQRDMAINPPPVTVFQDVPGVGTVEQTIDVPGANPDQFAPGLEQAEFGVQVADAQAAAADSRGADAGAVTSAQAAIIQAQTALDRLVNGPSEIDVHMAAIELQQAQLGVDLAQSNLDRAALRAPFDGVIGQLNLTLGEPPPRQEAAILMIDPSGYYIDLAIDETDIGRIEIGQQVELTLDALPSEMLTGAVTRTDIAPAALAPDQTQQVVTYSVRVQVDPTDAPLRAGMTATALILISERTDTLVLSNRFIRLDRDSGTAFVTIQHENGVFEEIPVALGARNDTESEILSGIDEGTRVVLVPRAAFTFGPNAQ